MLFKLLSLLAAGKGGAVAAAAIVAGATTVSVVTTSPEVQSGLNEVVAAVSGVLSPGMSQLKGELGCGQPVVVAKRNAADKMLRDGYQTEHRRLGELRKTKPADREAFNAIMTTAGEDLRTELRDGLNEVAKLTLGREGQIKIEFTEAPPADSTGDTTKPSCERDADLSPAPENSDESSKPEERGRVAVANRVTLDPALKKIVDDAKTEMKRIVDDAEKAVGDMETVERGKPEDKAKPESERGKPDERGKPSDQPGGKPSTPPGRSR
jgi:hypothetical protein